MKIIGYIIIAAIAFTVAWGLTNTDSPGTGGIDFSDTGDTSPDVDDSTEYGSYYEQLSNFEKKLYVSFLPVIKEKGKSVTLENINIDDFQTHALRALSALQYDNPEYFWFHPGYSGSIVRDSSFSKTGTLIIEPYYFAFAGPFFNADSQLEKLNKEVKRVAELARNHSSNDYERMIFVHDYLIENARYDHKGLAEYETTDHDPSCEYIFSAYGCLVNGDTVCAGYAKAYQLVMEELGYDCIYVTGDAGEAHAWNCVYIDGEGYFVDITWDDYDMKKEAPAYNYAFITGKDLAKTHRVDDKFAKPDCDATEYNYFVYHGYVAKTYDFETAKAILSAQADKNSAHIKFGSVSEMEKAYKDLIKGGKYKDIPGFNKIEYTSKNEKHMTITMFK